jgi:hypothetical protein
MNPRGNTGIMWRIAISKKSYGGFPPSMRGNGDEESVNANIHSGKRLHNVKNFERSRFFENGCVYCGDFF